MLAIKRPTLTVRGQVRVLPEFRLILVLQGDRHLERMARRRLMQSQRREAIQGPRIQRIRIHQIYARAAASCCIERREIRGHGLDGETLARKIAEELRGLAVESLRDPGGAHQ